MKNVKRIFGLCTAGESAAQNPVCHIEIRKPGLTLAAFWIKLIL
jgi:hypothetical protein